MRATHDRTLTNKEIAQRVGVHHSTISCYRSAKRVPTMTVLQDIFDEFHISKSARQALLDGLMVETTKEERRKLFGWWFNKNIVTKPSKAA